MVFNLSQIAHHVLKTFQFMSILGPNVLRHNMDVFKTFAIGLLYDN